MKDKKETPADELLESIREAREIADQLAESDKQRSAEIAEEIENLEEEADEQAKQIADLNKQVSDAQEALEKEKKEYLFLLADFDNFRKRVAKEKVELVKNGGEKVLSALLPIIDDFERGLQATKDAEDAQSIREGMELIYQKFVKFLEDNGVKEIPSAPGADFDTDHHEAIATIPAPQPDLKGKVIDTTQKGYTLNGTKVLRHAKVVVGE